MAWNWAPPAQCLHERTRGWWEALHLTISHNHTDQDANPYQLGGVAILSCNKTAHQVVGSGQDPTGLGRFCWSTYRGKDQILLWVVAGYWPCKTSNGHLSVLQQHWQFFDLQHPDQCTHPHTAFWMDLRPLLQEWGHHRGPYYHGIRCKWRYPGSEYHNVL